MDKPLVQNAADPVQVADAGKKLSIQRRNELNDLRRVLETTEGRRVIWRILEKCGVYRSVWHPSAQIHFNCGQQDLGHWVQAEITNADQEYLFLMMKENKERLQ
jgi:hypothetical protein